MVIPNAVASRFSKHLIYEPVVDLVGIIRKQALIMNIYMGELGSLNSNCSLFLPFIISRKEVFNLPGYKV